MFICPSPIEHRPAVNYPVFTFIYISYISN